MKALNILPRRVAARVSTSRIPISQLFDPKDGKFAIANLQRAAKETGRTLRLELV